MSAWKDDYDKYWLIQKFQNKKRFSYNYSYELYFASLISPDFQSDSRLTICNSNNALPRKIHLKKSYLALSWFKYLTKEIDSPTKKLSFSILPASRSLFTFQKAPMAHKTNSKEQFMFKFYFFKFCTALTTPHKCIPQSTNEALLVFYLTKKSFPFFETNLLFLKYYQISSMYTDSQFFSFSHFIRS
jgi:hypothetical protein